MKKRNWISPLVLILSLMVFSCGKGSNRTGGQHINPMVGVQGLDGTDVGTKVQVLLESNRCKTYAGMHFPVSMVFQKLGGQQQYGYQASTQEVNLSGLNTKEIAVGKTYFNDIIVVQDFGQTIQVVAFLCSEPVMVNNAQLAFLSTSSVNRCNLNQISKMEMLIHSNVGQLVTVAYPVYMDGAAPGICQ